MKYDDGLVLGSFYFDKIRIRTTHRSAGPLVEDVIRGTQRFNINFPAASRVYPGIEITDRPAANNLCACLLKSGCYHLLDTPGIVLDTDPPASYPTRARMLLFAHHSILPTQDL